MKKEKHLPKRSLSIEELEARLQLSGTAMVVLLSGSSCISNTPTIPGL